MKILSYIAAVVALSIVVYLFIGYKSSSDYIDEVEDERQEKEIWMSTSLESPFVMRQVAFTSLNYFPVDDKYRIEADFIRNRNKDQITLITNDGEERTYEVYGEANFVLDGIPCSIQVLSSEEELGSKMFIPFIDATSGEETYGAGRYLEADLPLTDKIILDFNQAYNPYCAYTDGFTCPFPPKANKLLVRIEAGEKAY